MEEILCVYKPVGLTPLQLIEQIRMSDDKYKNLKIGYAGRLDPLAHGIMLLTIGDGNKHRDKYLGLNKSYKFSVLFGVKTDSYDYLGLPEDSNFSEPPLDLEIRIKQFIKSRTSKFIQPYPPFSSKPVKGVPLYKLAKKGLLPKELPAKQVEIYNFKLEKIEFSDSPVTEKIIINNLKKIKGYFRQTRTIKMWRELFRKNPVQKLKLATFFVECSSGTYMRSLADKMGEEFGCGAIAFEIFRTQVGEYKIEFAKSYN